MDSTDMSGMTMMGGGTMGGMMMPWLHFTKGDNLFFMAWVPLSTGAVIGACIGLFLLAIIDRWVSAMRAVMQLYWSRRTEEILAARSAMLNDESIFTEKKRLSDSSVGSDGECLPPTQPPRSRITRLRRSAPFIPTHEFARGAMFACKSAVSYALMLAVMTFHAGYIIAIIAGLGVGEVLFGRFGTDDYHH
ncbi:Ctr copper transporter [Hysterangium stoloniferum]|nr:Ctr copper transporter [Hysterangium stoloniferum]